MKTKLTFNEIILMRVIIENYTMDFEDKTCKKELRLLKKLNMMRDEVSK